MASSLSCVNKISSHLLTSKHVRLWNQKRLVSQCKQYSRSVQPQYRLEEDNTIDNYISDNREFLTDIVTKIKIERIDVAERLCSTKKDNVVLSSDTSKESSGRPSPEKLLQVFTILGENLPKLFVQPLDYSIYHENMVFEDNIRNMKTQGLLNYVRQVALLRTVGHFKFAYVKFEILKITQHPEDGTVRIRWRIRGISALKVILQFWRYKLWDWKEMFEKSDSWYDGYSTFYVNSEGKIVKHVADKMMPDQDQVIATGTPLAGAKLALMIAVIPKFSDLGFF